MMEIDSYEIANYYGVQYSGTLVTGTYHESVDYSRTYTLKEIEGAKGKITRLRILAERGIGDISYIHATLPDGKIVPVNNTLGQVRMNRLMGDLIRWAKEEGVYAKGIDLLDQGVRSVMY